MGNTAAVGEREVTRTRTLQFEERTSDGLVEVTDVGDDESSLALMRELGWVRADVHGEDAKAFREMLEEPARVIPELAEKLRERRVNGSPGFTPAKIPRVAFGPEIGAQDSFIAAHPELVQRVVLNTPIDDGCECSAIACAHHVGPCGAAPAQDFMLSGWVDSVALCEKCMLTPLPKEAAGNGKNGFTPAGELEVGTPVKDPEPRVVTLSDDMLEGIRRAINDGSLAIELKPFNTHDCPSCKGTGCCAHREFRRLANGNWTCKNGDPGCESCDTCKGSGTTKKSLSEKLDELLPREIGKHGNGSVAGVAATVAVLVELLSSELGRRF